MNRRRPEPSPNWNSTDPSEFCATASPPLRIAGATEPVEECRRVPKGNGQTTGTHPEHDGAGAGIEVRFPGHGDLVGAETHDARARHARRRPCSMQASVAPLFSPLCSGPFELESRTRLFIIVRHNVIPIVTVELNAWP